MVSNFFCVLQWSREKSKTMVMRKIGGKQSASWSMWKWWINSSHEVGTNWFPSRSSRLGIAMHERKGLGGLLLMFLDVCETVLLITQSFSGTFLAEPSYKVLRIATNLFWKFNHIHPAQDNVVGLHGVCAIEWWTAVKSENNIFRKMSVFWIAVVRAQENNQHWNNVTAINCNPGGTPWNSWWGVPLGSPSPDPISDQNMSFCTPVVRPGM